MDWNEKVIEVCLSENLEFSHLDWVGLDPNFRLYQLLRKKGYSFIQELLGWPEIIPLNLPSLENLYAQLELEYATVIPEHYNLKQTLDYLYDHHDRISVTNSVFQYYFRPADFPFGLQKFLLESFLL